ncbi:hypothetical protein L484_018745 [Morus notabilis]|uniref:Putative plant transposon protein domain-containing protein n=1 Tax=Morus notabilis TaxID=981085 RepID=W9S5G5_9ROSA|nr:hypothetical protein L484_018745 [Morus notabilis]
MPRKVNANQIKFGASSSNSPPIPAPVELPALAVPPIDYDNTRFVSKDAEKQYERHNKNRGCIGERGFEIRYEGLPPEIAKVIRDRSWQKFCSEPAAGSITLVREFFTNAKKCTNSKTKQQDSPDRDPHAILEALCDGPARWTIKNNTESAFEAKYLANYTNVWLHFVCARLIPSTHISEVTIERALVLLAIERGEPLNVGVIINNGIHHALGHNSIGLPFPWLLTELVLAAGVAIPDEHLKKLIRAFDLNDIIRITSGRAASEQDEGGAGSSQPPLPKRKGRASTSREDHV